MRALVLFVLPAVACDRYLPEDFAADYAEATCVLYEGCEVLGTSHAYASVADCETQVAQEVDVDACEFDEEMAKQCVDAVNQLTCTQLYDETWPDDCDFVCR